MPVGVVRFDRDGSVVYANHHALELLGSATLSTIDDVLQDLAPGDAELLGELVRARCVSEHDTVQQVHLERTDGVHHIDCSVRRLGGRTGDAPDSVMTLVDVSESVRLRTELERRASTDGLTATLNRAATLARLAHPARGTAVVYLDIDRFKDINDSFGHIAGDAVLCSLARRLAAAIGTDGFVGRLGGDEFVVVAPGVPHDDAALELGRRLATAAAHVVRLPLGSVGIQASVGVAVADGDEADPDALVARADAAMYRSKRARRGEAVLAEEAHAAAD
jgi:diguanylate cyclase (GGDEF)-like protein